MKTATALAHGVVALVTALLCTGLHAQANTAFYGLLDLHMRWDQANGTRTASLGSGLSRGSRLGLRSREDLGDGVYALTMLETGFNVDDGQILATGATAQGWGRQMWLGVGKSDVGIVAAGRQYTPLFSISAGALDPLGANYLGAITTTQALQGGMTARVSGAVSYTYGYPTALDAPAPRSGFSVAALYAPGNQAATQTGRHIGFSTGYGRDPWFFGYGFHQSHLSPSANASQNTSQTAQVMGGTYRIGPATLFTSLHRTWNAIAAVDRRNGSFGVSIPGLGGNLIFQTLRSRDKTSAGQHVRNVSATYEYPLSRRTVTYLSFAQNRNSSSAAVALYQAPGGLAISPGGSPWAAAVGFRTSF